MAAVEGVGRVAARDRVGDTTHDLYRLYGRQIYAYCLHKLRSREEAEDAVQTTFMNAFRSLQRGTTTQYEQAWLFKIAQNVCHARAASSTRRLRLETPNDFEVLQEIVPAQDGEGSLELMGVEEALESMPENQRRAILLREWQGLSYREISEELGVTQTAVEMLIFRARRTLAGALERPAEKKQTRVARLAGAFGSLAGVLKTLLTGGAAVKAAAVAAAAIAVGEGASHTIVAKPAPAKAREAAPAVVAVARPARHVAAPVVEHRAVAAAPAPAVAPQRRVKKHVAVHHVARHRVAPASHAPPAPVVAPPPVAAPAATPVPTPPPAPSPAPAAEQSKVEQPKVEERKPAVANEKKAKAVEPPAAPAPVESAPAPAEPAPAAPPSAEPNGNAYGREKHKENGKWAEQPAPVVTEPVVPVETTPVATELVAAVAAPEQPGNGKGRDKKQKQP